MSVSSKSEKTAAATIALVDAHELRAQYMAETINLMFAATKPAMTYFKVLMQGSKHGAGVGHAA